jgi:quercetin dioxygenase-like cupin family protein
MAGERELLNHPMALARVIELGAGTASPAHYHSNVHEYIVCLDGEICLFAGDGSNAMLLRPGDHAAIATPTVHWLRNDTDRVARYLLVQSGGAHDFLAVD